MSLVTKAYGVFGVGFEIADTTSNRIQKQSRGPRSSDQKVPTTVNPASSDYIQQLPIGLCGPWELLRAFSGLDKLLFPTSTANRGREKEVRAFGYC